MKQTSLLDSFLKRQNKQVPNSQKNSNQKTTKSEQKNPIKTYEYNNQDGNKNSNDNDKKIPMTSSKNTNKKWTTLDSDDQQDYIDKCKNKLKQICIDNQPSNNNQQMDIESEYDQPTPAAVQTKKERQSKLVEANKCTNVGMNVGNNNNKENDDNFLDQFTDATPIWAQRQHCKDAQMRSPNHPHYDPTTLHIPDIAWNKFTAPMKQFWRTKSQNFDKVILFKLGKFYELFYEDAMIGNKYLELKYMGTKMHTGFPEKSLDRYVQELVRLGFKTVIMEQMETPDQVQQRIKSEKAQGRKSQKTINREVTQILTKGTLPYQDDKTYLPNYLLSVRLYADIIAFGLLEISSNEILLGIVDDIQKFKTVLFQTRPVEVVFDPDNIPFQLLRMMEKSFLQMQISKLMNKNNLWHPLTAVCQLQKLEKEGKIKKAKIFQAIDKMPENNKNLIYSTLSGLFDYLKKVFKFEYVITAARFTFYQKQKHSHNMVLDSQSLQHLEIFQTAEGEAGSLFSVIDRTKTKFGKRLLRRWIMSPLMNVYHINQRLNAVEDLQQISIDREKVNTILKRLPDMEKKVNKLYHYAIKTTSASKAIYFQDLNTARLRQFRDVMEKMETAWEAINILSKKSSSFKSLRLKQLVTLTRSSINQDEVYYEDEDDQSTFEGLLPNIIESLQQFKLFVKWENDMPLPQKGLAASFDNLQEELDSVKKQLDQYLESIRYQMSQPNLKFVHTKQRYEIQIPEKSEKRRPKIFEFTSKRVGFSRYISPTTKKYVKTVQKLQESIKQQMGLFIGFFFEQFKKKQKIWQRYMQILAQIDCLISLSEYSFANSKVRPQFCEDQRKFEIREAKHPCLTHIDFIPNDIILQKKVMLLTGPNMGGKSTILRTACTLAVLAQIGCFVPAQKYHCQTVDRIFTRIGASDKLELGKSTFFIQMQQTKNVLTYGTQKSIAIIDELGRGTSTFDGMAIAYSVLRQIIHSIKCYCLFATHYHILIQQFEKQAQVTQMMMDSVINKDRLIFLYKLVPGHVQQSFGLNVAKLVGIPAQAISLAQIKAQQMNNEIQDKRNTILQQIYRFIE